MKTLMKAVAMVIVVVLYGAIFSSAAYAGSCGGVQNPADGSPPYGLAIQSDAAGTKLYGVANVEFYNMVATGQNALFDARIVLRLRKGSVLKTLYGSQKGVVINSVQDAQNAVAAIMEPKIINAFFGGATGLKATIKNVSDLGEVNADECPYSTVCDMTDKHWDSEYHMLDVEIAVK